MKTLIISPHVDDELYGCLGYILTHPNTVLRYITTSETQIQRFKVISEIFERFQIPVDCFQLGLFEDTKGNEPTSFHNCVDYFDKCFTEGFQRVLFNSESHHQDHTVINKAVKVSLRSRPELTVTEAFEYDYLYNNINSENRIDLLYSSDILELIQDIWEQFNYKCEVCKSPDHVSHFNNALLFNRYVASFESKPYSESFHIARYVKDGLIF